MKKRGFTLAEVLISLGIIGVVSAITMPALTANYQKKTYEAAVKKAYNTLSTAVETYMANEGVDDLLDSDLNENREKLNEFINSYFKVAQDCDGYYYKEKGAKCFAKEYKSLDRSTTTDVSTYQCMVTVVLTDGMSICADAGTTEGHTAEDGTQISSSTPKLSRSIEAMTFEVDTNGLNGPNIYGRDYFLFYVNSAGKVYDPDWIDEKDNEDSEEYHKNPDSWYGAVKSKTGPVSIGKLMADGWQMLY